MALPKKRFLFITFLISFGLAFFVSYTLFMGDPDLSNVKAAYTGTTSDFLNTIKDDSKTWVEAKKVVTLSGVITSKDQKGVLLDDSVYFRFAEGTSTDEFTDGQTVKVKGSIETYDDVLEELNLRNAVLVK